ncbi:MAG TPA: hypothetical protein VJL39_03195 [Candidatus Paceibacterota bacterium]
MRFIIIVGVLDPLDSASRAADWPAGWGRELEAAFPECEIVLLRDRYLWWQHEKILRLRNRCIELLSDGRPSVIIGYSFGGCITLAAAAHASRANIKLIVTLSSPHSFDAFGVGHAKRVIGVPANGLRLPIMTYGALIDPFIFPPFTALSGSVHKNIRTGHWGFIFNPSVRNAVIADMKYRLHREGEG